MPLRLPSGPPPSRRYSNAVANAHRRGLDAGRRWGSTDARPEEIGRVTEALRACREMMTGPDGAMEPGLGGLMMLVRLAFLIKPELLAQDLDAATAAARAFWRNVLGDAYERTQFDDETEVGVWMTGFAEGAIEGHGRLCRRGLLRASGDYRPAS